MAWNESVVTKDGVMMLNELLAGRALTITRAIGGSGTVDFADLEELTALPYPKQTLSLLGIDNEETGKKVKIQITSAGLETGYTLQQVAVFARLGDEDMDRLLFVMQDNRGIDIPADGETPGFILEMYAVIAITNKVKIKIITDSGAVVSVGMLEESIKQHNKDPEAHKDLLRQLANSLFYIGDTEPESGPVLWFDTRKRASEEDIILLQIGGAEDEAPVVACVDDVDHPITNTEEPTQADANTIEIIIQ